ncbi:MAG TPA: P pilus assembly protein, chaperone PapD [Nostocaceae cyanobacterium]|nr:P pilus assembly protein, chaperone PapD [Nostocaceae cyanobacterium]
MISLIWFYLKSINTLQDFFIKNMLHQNCLSLAAAGVGLSTLMLFSHPAKAQMSVSPLIIEAKAERGQAQGMITISNTSNAPTRVRVYAEPFTYDRDKGFTTLPSSPNDLTKYLQFSPRELTINPGESRRVRLISRLAPSLTDGEYRAVVFNETLTEGRDSAGNSVGLVARIGVTFYVRKGNIAPMLNVRNASFNPERKQIQVLVNNSGQATAVTGINWTLRQGENVVKTGKVDASAVIANSDRYFLLSYPNQDKDSLKPGEYQLSGELTWGENNQNKVPFNVNVLVAK